MKKELGPNQEKWVRALESGKFKNANGYLYNPNTDGYCCLGVACVVFDVKKETMPDPQGLVWTKYGQESAMYYVPKEVIELLGLRDTTGKIERKDIKSLAEMNDRGHAFEDIAKFIRENPGLAFIDVR